MSCLTLYIYYNGISTFSASAFFSVEEVQRRRGGFAVILGSVMGTYYNVSY